MRIELNYDLRELKKTRNPFYQQGMPGISSASLFKNTTSESARASTGLPEKLFLLLKRSDKML